MQGENLSEWKHKAIKYLLYRDEKEEINLPLRKQDNHRLAEPG